jgi:uncharacterized heparinase superfamily protein
LTKALPPTGVALRYWHTARHLRPVQIVGRFSRYLPRAKLDRQTYLPPRLPTGDWRRPASRAPSMLGPRNFRFLNLTAELASAADWNAARYAKLWLYNLHYFDDLNASGSAERTDWHRALIARWIADNAPEHGNGWEPYPLSLRIVNWIKWVLGGNRPADQMTQSLAIQARALRRKIEWHLLGNHLLANAKALIFAGLYFDGDEAEDWLNTGLSILARELREQILADGGHFELSPMYHSLALEDLLDLVNVARVYSERLPVAICQDWMNATSCMRRWLAALSHPDGGIAFFNDAAHGIAPTPAELSSYAERLDLPPVSSPGAGVTYLDASGYVRIEEEGAVALLDIGAIGPDYLPGHAHADTLSFELSLAGKRLFVNSGTSLYEASSARELERSTESHNSVAVHGESSSEVWASFRVARRARPFGIEIDAKGEEIVVRAAHDGYRRLGDITHWREWRFHSGGFVVSDRLDGAFEQATSYFHLHPRFRLFPDHGAIASYEGFMLTYVIRSGRPALVPYYYHPEFGLSESASCLAVEFTGPTSALEFRIA